MTNIINDLKSLCFHDNPANFSDCEIMGLLDYCGLYCPLFLKGDCRKYTKEDIISDLKKLDKRSREIYLNETEISLHYPEIFEA